MYTYKCICECKIRHISRYIRTNPARPSSSCGRAAGRMGVMQRR